jgi:phospholipase D-like protein/VCBS repeat protein
LTLVENTMATFQRHSRAFATIVLGLLLAAVPRDARALERLCDPSVEDCRAEVLRMIDAETVGIDVGLWFMEDARWSAAIIRRAQAGVRVRILMDPRATDEYPNNGPVMSQLAAAGVPMRKRVAAGIEHWKMMLFAGQNIVYFGSANFSPFAWVPIQPYADYVDETVYLTDDPVVVNSFKTQFDDAWVNTTSYANFANATAPQRMYPVFAIDPELNFPPAEDFATRSVARYNAETVRIDAIMFRSTDERHTNALLGAIGRGVPVRLIIEQDEYRNPVRPWDSWNVDRLYVGGVAVRMRGHAGVNHEKMTLLHGQQLTIFGSSNWSEASANSQHEHNYFTHKLNIYQWFVAQFERKWNNTNPIGAVETVPFRPLPPDRPAVRVPANAAIGVATTGAVLRWYGGPWAHIYDVYFGTSPNPPLVAAGLNLGPSETAGQLQSFTLPALAGTTRYYWKVVARTAANVTAESPVWNFVTMAAPDKTARGDFDGDRRTDRALFRPSTGTWYWASSASGATTGVQWGNANDRPVRGDYDGDGRADIAVFRPSNGTWYVVNSGSGQATGVQWGSPGDIPVPADYDGDGKSDYAVFRPSNGTWYIRYSSSQTTVGAQWGNASDVPVPGDYDGDGRADFAVFRPSDGVWYFKYARGGTAGVQWGNGSDVPVAGDYDGDGKTDVAVFRPASGVWYLRYANGQTAGFQWGNGADVPIPGDYDGDGRFDIAVFRPSVSTWFLWYSSTSTAVGVQWGVPSDVPILRRP